MVVRIYNYFLVLVNIWQFTYCNISIARHCVNINILFFSVIKMWYQSNHIRLKLL